MGKPLISGFVFITKEASLAYPIQQSIESIEPLCDEIIIHLEESAGEKNNLRAIFTHEKYRFLQGLTFNEALRECQGSYCLVIRPNEIVRLEELSLIHDAVIDLEQRPEVEGLIFHYQYLKEDELRPLGLEVALIRNHLGIKYLSFEQGFRHFDERKLRARRVKAHIRILNTGHKALLPSPKWKTFGLEVRNLLARVASGRIWSSRNYIEIV